METRRRRLDEITKDFLYQTGHLLSAMRRTLYYDFGLTAGDRIIAESLREYAELFTEEKAVILSKEAEQDFLLP